MAGVHIEVRDSSRRDAAVRQTPASSNFAPTLKLIALWLAVLLPLAYGVFEAWQEARVFFAG